MRIVFYPQPVQNFPATELRAALPDLLEAGCTVIPKFTCSYCRERVQATLTNEFPKYMTCPNCGSLHDFDESGGNYALGKVMQRKETSDGAK